MLTHFTSETSAYYSSRIDEQIEIQAGTWWDKSNLSFEQDPKELNLETCEAATIRFPIRNSGFTMIGPTSYKILYNHEMLQDGTLGEVANNELSTISVTADREGSYQVIVDQRPGYQGNYDQVTSVSSSPVTVTCPPPPKEKEEKDKDKGTDGQEKNDTNSDNKKDDGNTPADPSGNATPSTDLPADPNTNTESNDKQTNKENTLDQQSADAGNGVKEGDKQ